MKICTRLILTIGIFFWATKISLCPVNNLTTKDRHQLRIECQKFQDIVDICETLKWIESRGRYDIKGNSREYGIVQFTWSTWKRLCLKFEGKILDWTIPGNQEKILFKQVEWLLSKDYNPAQIASIWNCGSKRWSGKCGINKYGIRYDVPKYVRKFLNKYYGKI